VSVSDPIDQIGPIGGALQCACAGLERPGAGLRDGAERLVRGKSNRALRRST